MPSVQYYNQTAPFWDFIASMEEQGASHPFFAGNSNNNNGTSNGEQQRGHPMTEGWPGAPWGAFHPSARHGPPHGHHPPPPPPPHEHHNATAPAEKEHDPEEGSSDSQGPPPPFAGEPADHQHERGPHRGPGSHRGRCGPRGRGGWGGWGGRGRGGPFGFPGAGHMGGLNGLAEMFQSQLFGQDDSAKEEKSQDFKPEADVFDTPDSFVIHISLPGAKKEDVSVSWDAESSQLIVAGVVFRPGDEELLKTLALDERKVGAFERKVRLGSRANPAQVEADSISAKLEDGVLRIDVPKLDSGYVEIKKVDIE